MLVRHAIVVFLSCLSEGLFIVIEQGIVVPVSRINHSNSSDLWVVLIEVVKLSVSLSHHTLHWNLRYVHLYLLVGMRLVSFYDENLPAAI